MNNKTSTADNKGLIMGENGLYVKPDFLLEKKSEYAAQDGKIESHNKARRDEIRAPVPGVQVPFSFVMTKAVRPKMINLLAHTKMVQLDIEGDEKFKAEAHGMTRVVFNEQEIVSVGKNAAENFKVGQLVKIDFRRFANVRDTNEQAPTGEYSKYIDVPIHRIDGHDYIMIDQRDIVWVCENNHQLEDIKGFEDETV
jgi:hypothetical protein